MNLDEMRKLRAECEAQILDATREAVKELQDQTGLTVDAVNVNMVVDHSIGRRAVAIVTDVSLSVRL